MERCKASERQSKRVVRELKSVLVLLFFLINLKKYNTFSLLSTPPPLSSQPTTDRTSGWKAERVGEEGGESDGQAAES